MDSERDLKPLGEQRDVQSSNHHVHRGRRSAYAGMAAEDITLRVYEERGAELKFRRWRCEGGEIDLILSHGDMLIFVEVKQRKKSNAWDAPVSKRQWRRLVDAANMYILEVQRETGATPICRFDIALVGHDGRAEIIENAWS